YMSRRQALSAPRASLDDLADPLRVLESEGVVIGDSARVQFFHESFFDYCFARRFAASGDRLHVLLTSDEQHLFRRAQVRHILRYRRQTEFQTYLTDLRDILVSDEIRFHLKKVAFLTLAIVDDPRPDEWSAIESFVRDPRDPLTVCVRQATYGSLPWFELLE